MTGRLRALLIVAIVAAMAAVGLAVKSSDGAHTKLTQAVTTTTPSTTTSTTTAAPTTSTTALVHPPRDLVEQDWTPFATVGGITLVHPSRRVERIGFHESNNDGARVLEALPTAVKPFTQETRDRGNPPRTAADIVSDPNTEIRSPVTGTVKRGGTYTLYCKYTDSYLVIEPDAHPGWEVKLLHIDGVLVHAGDRVEAGVTVVSPRPHRLPFPSTVEDSSALPSWPHVHVEVVDPTIKDRPGEPC